MAKSKFHFDVRFLFVAIIFVIAAYIILPQIGGFKASGQLLRHPKTAWLPGALIFMSLTYLAAAATYYFLAFKKLKYWRTVIVQLAAMFINRLLPGGIGALGANYVYLKRNHNSGGEAGTIVAINNALGFMGHGILTVLVLMAYSGQAVSLGNHESDSWSHLIKYIIIGMAAVLILGVVFGRRRIAKAMKQVSKQLISYKHQPRKLVTALISSMLLTASNVACLYFCMHAMGVSLSIFAVFLIFSFGVTAGTATPTPGGLGGYEAAIMAGFVAYGVAGPPALAVALLYRVVSYWLPLLAGSVAFIFTQKRRYI